MIDLHVHTTYSDGQYTPAEVVALAANAGIKVLAIADHDTIGGLAVGSKVAMEHRIDFINAIELSVQGNRELHILGYGIDSADTLLLGECAKFERYRTERAKRVLDFLREHGVNISIEEVLKASGGRASIGRPHFAAVMVEKGHVSSIREAFDKYLGTAEFDKIERPKPTAEEGIALIRKSGGVPVLAHPALLKLDDVALEKLLCRLIDFGIQGIECHYSLHSVTQTRTYLELAHKYDLLVTCGSDFHGENIKPDIKIGMCMNGALDFYDYKIIEKLRGSQC